MDLEDAGWLVAWTNFHGANCSQLPKCSVVLVVEVVGVGSFGTWTKHQRVKLSLLWNWLILKRMENLDEVDLDNFGAERTLKTGKLVLVEGLVDSLQPG